MKRISNGRRVKKSHSKIEGEVPFEDDEET